MQVKLMIARFTYGDWEHPTCVDWLIKTYYDMKIDPRVSEVFMFRIADTPITMSRNAAIEAAKANGVDYVLMVDTDMAPDLQLPGAKPFWKSSFDFILNHPRSMIGAPYCGPPPNENVYIFRYENHQSDNPNADMKIAQYTRFEAASRSGIEEVAALPTGVFLLDMRCIDLMKPPYFRYEWTDVYEQAKASTEDVVFSRDAATAGASLYCNWDAWAGHWKAKCVTKPSLLTIEMVREQYHEALLRGGKKGESIVQVEPDPALAKNGRIQLAAKPEEMKLLTGPVLEHPNPLRNGAAKKKRRRKKQAA